MATIIENGEQMDVTDQQAESLARADIIYACDDETCCNCFHIRAGASWAEVEAAL